jgi:hypothetical protein
MLLIIVIIIIKIHRLGLDETQQKQNFINVLMQHLT